MHRYTCLVASRRLKILALCAVITPLAHGKVLLEESFDDQPDWTSGMEENDLGGWPNGSGPDRVQCVEDGHVVPEGWDCVRQNPEWAPSVGHPDRHENLEIVSRNSDKARGASGKSLVIWRDSTTGPEFRWNSDGILTKKLLDGYQKLYVKFWIRFGDNWTPLGETGQTKLFRVTSWDGPGTDLYGFGGDRDNAPAFFWQYKHDINGGARLYLSFRGDPQETNYKMQSDPLTNTPRSFINGFLSLNLDDNIRDLNGDGVKDNEITSLMDLKKNLPVTGIVPHDNIFGDKWHKIEFYFEMNSAPGKHDGVTTMWMDNQLVFDNQSVPWMGMDSPGDRQWNTVHFGGNSHFHAYPDSQRREEWYAIDDIVIRSDLPSGRESKIKNAPKPPSNVSIE